MPADSTRCASVRLDSRGTRQAGSIGDAEEVVRHVARMTVADVVDGVRLVRIHGGNTDGSEVVAVDAIGVRRLLLAQHRRPWRRRASGSLPGP